MSPIRIRSFFFLMSYPEYKFKKKNANITSDTIVKLGSFPHTQVIS